MTEFEKVFEDNREFIFKYLLKLTKNPSLSEELTGETFFRAYMNYAGLRDKEKVSTWLCQIAKNTYYSYCAKEKRRSEHMHEEILFSVEDDCVNSDTAFELHKRLHNLPEPYKEVFSLRVFGELPFSKIAELFNKTESWARVTYHRAKLKMEDRQDGI